MRLNRMLGVALGAALFLLTLAGPASADRLVDYHFNHIDGATVAAKLYQQFGGDKGLYVDVKMRNTRRFPGCVNGAVAWRRSGRDVVDFKTTTRPIRACAKKRWIALGRTPVRRVRDFSRVYTHVAVEGGKGQWKDLIGWERRTVKRKADRIMNMSYRSFIKYKRAAIHNRHHGGAREDHTWPLDWADDGCSIPKQDGFPLAAHWSRFFDRPCQQHDFAYRNYGKDYLALNRREDTRLRIDTKLNREAKRACRNNLGGGGVNRTVKRHLCYGAANTVYHGVRVGGWKAFFGLE